MKIRLLTIAFFLGASLAMAQTADELESLLATKTLSYGKAAEIAAKASGNEVALADWLPKNAAAEDAARCDAVSLLLIKSFKFKAGAFYAMTKKPHYAYRELVYKKVIQGRTAPGDKVSGEEFLFMVNRCLALEEELDAEVAERDRKAAEKEARIAAEKARKEAAQREAERAKLAEQINEELAVMKLDNTTRAEVSDEGVRISFSNIHFVADSAEWLPEEAAKLAEIAEILKKIKERRILVAGHTANAASARDLKELSLERAEAVKNYLVENKVRAAREVFTAGYGAERPVADNETDEGMAKNRRVEITILE
jgi:outer membrane protein OmpA-like peptidoglycan-associated protein